MTQAELIQSMEDTLGTIIAALSDRAMTDTRHLELEGRLAKLELLTDRMEAGMANWKSEMSRLASRIEKQAYRMERARDEVEEADIFPPDIPGPLPAQERILARRKKRAVSE